jgi:hypothetical protein
MSFNVPMKVLYRRLPRDKRICTYYRCGQPVLRNLDRDWLLKTGQIIHHGCLMAAQDERYRCLECFTIFNAIEAAFDEHQIVHGDEVRQDLRVICPNCGCQNLKPLKPLGGSETMEKVP